jgi:uracil-DNA glycosylase
MTMLIELNHTIVQCRRCPRLVRWRETSAQNPPRKYLGEKYWAKPLPGFGDPNARVLIVGLAPAARGDSGRDDCFRNRAPSHFEVSRVVAALYLYRESPNKSI